MPLLHSVEPIHACIWTLKFNISFKRRFSHSIAYVSIVESMTLMNCEVCLTSLSPSTVARLKSICINLQLLLWRIIAYCKSSSLNSVKKSNHDDVNKVIVRTKDVSKRTVFNIFGENYVSSTLLQRHCCPWFLLIVNVNINSINTHKWLLQWKSAMTSLLNLYMTKFSQAKKTMNMRWSKLRVQ